MNRATVSKNRGIYPYANNIQYTVMKVTQKLLSVQTPHAQTTFKYSSALKQRHKNVSFVSDIYRELVKHDKSITRKVIIILQGLDPACKIETQELNAKILNTISVEILSMKGVVILIIQRFKTSGIIAALLIAASAQLDFGYMSSPASDAHESKLTFNKYQLQRSTLM